MMSMPHELADIEGTAQFLAQHGRINAVWLDETLVARSRIGPLSDFIQLGRTIIQSVPALLGYEEELTSLQEDPAKVIDIPNVALHTQTGGTPKFNLSILWRSDRKSYVVLLGPVFATQTPDLENLVRGRLIAEEKLRQTTAELERINRDLEEFAYIISHDLKVPLRTLKYLSGDVRTALETTPADLAAAQAASHDMIAQSNRMSSMLVGLLEYAQIGRKSEAVERVDTRALINEIVAGMRPGASIAIRMTGAWPITETLPVPLDLVLRNLISNAIKHHDRQQASIELAAGSREHFFTFAVIDDGPGIDPSWHEAVFQPFRTVFDVSGGEAAAQDPDSSGIGLALVKRAIETVGGRIELKSDPAVTRGATFTVFWPKTFAKT
jgi:signal transduction histidine kinase